MTLKGLPAWTPEQVLGAWCRYLRVDVLGLAAGQIPGFRAIDVLRQEQAGPRRELVTWLLHQLGTDAPAWFAAQSADSLRAAAGAETKEARLTLLDGGAG